MPEIFSGSVTDKAQADGAQSISLGADDRFRQHQIQVEVSATPSAGSLAVAVKTPGASAFQEIGAIDLTATLKPMQFSGLAAEIQLTPSGFDADKTYSVYVASGAGA